MITIFGMSIDDFFKKDKEERNKTKEPDFSVIGKALDINHQDFDMELVDNLCESLDDFECFLDDMDDYYYSEDLVEAITNQFEALESGLNALKRFISENRKEKN